MVKASLRERKKAETRTAIVDAAMKLFLKNGYEKTTLTDIAEVANISQRTIFTYFPSKEAIIFDSDKQVVAELIQFLNDRGDLSILDALRIYQGTSKLPKVNRKKQLLIKMNPVLQEYSSNILLRLEYKLTKIIAAERGLPPHSIQTQLIAASFRAMVALSITGKIKAEDGDTAIKFIEAGLKATSS